MRTDFTKLIKKTDTDADVREVLLHIMDALIESAPDEDKGKLARLRSRIDIEISSIL